MVTRQTTIGQKGKGKAVRKLPKEYRLMKERLFDFSKAVSSQMVFGDLAIMENFLEDFIAGEFNKIKSIILREKQKRIYDLVVKRENKYIDSIFIQRIQTLSGSALIKSLYEHSIENPDVAHYMVNRISQIDNMDDKLSAAKNCSNILTQMLNIKKGNPLERGVEQLWEMNQSFQILSRSNVAKLNAILKTTQKGDSYKAKGHVQLKH